MWVRFLTALVKWKRGGVRCCKRLVILALETMERDLDCSEVLGKQLFIVVDMYFTLFISKPESTQKHAAEIVDYLPAALAGPCIRSL